MFALIEKYKLLLFLVFTISSNLFGQNYTLSGRVTELERTAGAPQTEVRVDIDNSKFIAFTNADGTYSISGVPAGVHTVRISKPGFIGVYKANYTLDSNKTLNIALADTIQESPAGTQVLKLDEYRELPPFDQYKGLTVVNGEFLNGPAWRGVTEGNLIPVILKFANSTDSLAFRNAIGACNGNWQNSPVGSVEREEKRAIYLLSNDPTISYTKRGIRVNFHAGSPTSAVLEYELNSPYIYRAEVNLMVNSARAIQKEVKGRCEEKGDIFFRPSYMNSNAVEMTDLDHMLNTTLYNQWAALARGDQNTDIIDMENTPIFAIPIATSITNPTNNASDLEKSVRIQYDNIFGADKYRLQISTMEDFSTILKDLDVFRNDTTLALDAHTTYYARVQAINSKGSGPVSAKVKFTTKNLLPQTPVTDTPQNGVTLNAANYLNGQLILKYTTTAKDGDNDNVTTTFIVLGSNVNKTFNSTTGGQVTQTIDSLLFQPGQTYNVSISSTDGIGTVNGISTTFIAPAVQNHPPTTPVTDVPVNGITLTAANYQNGKLILKYTTTAKDADNDNVTTTFIVLGSGVNKTFNSTTGGQITQTIDSILFQPDQTYNTSISATDGKITVNGAGTTFKTAKLNTAPTTFMFIRPADNTIATYKNGKLEIETSIPTDVDGDPLTKKIRMYSAGVIDTLMSGPGTTQIIYIDSAKIKLDTEFTLTGEVTDGKATTPASNSVRFKTPKPTGIDDTVYKNLKVGPVPCKDYLNVEYDPTYVGTRRIISLDGKVLDSREINGETYEQIDMTRYGRGMYLLEINNLTIKILKK